MSAAGDQPVLPRALVERVRNILVRPTSEWEVIDAEPATIGGLYRNYLCILAAIGPVCAFIGSVVFGYSTPIGHVRPSVVAALSGQIGAYIGALAGVTVVALLIDALAPRFGGEKNRIQAFKVAVYGSTPGMVSGVFMLIPQLSMLSIVGLYSLYLLYLGMPKLMRVTGDRALGYFAAVLGAAIVLWFLIILILTMLTRLGGA